MRILKNLIRKLEKRFDWFKSQPRPMWGIFILLTVAGVILWIASFKDIDTIPATTMDYQPLEEQTIAIQQNPQLLFKTNCEVEIDSDFITVTLENKNCKLITKYNKNFEIVSSSKKDKSMFWLLALLLSFVVACLELYGICIVIAALLSIYLFVFYLYSSRSNSSKKIFKKKMNWFACKKTVVIFQYMSTVFIYYLYYNISTFRPFHYPFHDYFHIHKI